MWRALPQLTGILIIILAICVSCNTNPDEDPLKPFLTPNDIFVIDSCDLDIVLFQQQILPTVKNTCATGDCHSTDTKAGGIVLDNFQSIIQLVEPNLPDQSYLYQAYQNTDTTLHIPALDFEISPREVEQIEKWITQKALNTNCDTYCEFTDVSISDVTEIRNGSKPNLSFNIEVEGANLSSAYRVTGGGIDTIITYNSVATLQTKDSIDTNRGVVITLTDTEKSYCVVAKRVSMGGVEDSECGILGSGLTNVQCSDNGTPQFQDDDYISFTLNPRGRGLSNNYILRGPDIDTTGTFGVTQTFRTPGGTLGQGDITLILVDSSDLTCSFEFTLTDPVTCSSVCDIQDAGLTNIACNNNGTPADSTDDYITFSLNPTGTGLVNGYTVAFSNQTFSGNYGQESDFQTPEGTLGKGDLTLTITDNDSSTCILEVTLTDPGTCATPSDTSCQITDVGLDKISCNDNGTPDNMEDDYITFTISPAGVGLGSEYTLTGGDSNNPGLYGSGAYNVPTEFQSPVGTAGQGDITLTITDTDSSTCSIQFTLTDPGVCAPGCNLQDAGVSDIQCHDNDTPNDTEDDYILFTLNPTGNSLSDTYALTSTGIDETGSYGTPTTFQTPPGTAGKGDFTLRITDGDSISCSIQFTLIDPGVCTPSCELQEEGITSIQCRDNGTPENLDDDYITFSLNPVGTGLSGGYTLTGTDINLTGEFGQATDFQTPTGTAGKGNISLTITDQDSATCELTFMLTDPGSCTPECNIQNGGLDDIACNDNNTPNDSNDDFITFSLNPTGSGLGTSYAVTGSGLDETGAYGQKTTFQTAPGTAGKGDVMITVTDGDTAGCEVKLTVFDPGVCVPTCNLSQPGLADVACDDNETPNNPDDDFIIFTLNPTGMGLGDTYTLTGEGIEATGSYGQQSPFETPTGTAGKGNISLTLTDVNNPQCILSFTLEDPGACTPDCNVSDVGLTDVACNDNNTPANTDDDFITFSLNPTGSGLGAIYSLTGEGIDATGTYGQKSNFETPIGTAGKGNIMLTLTDTSDTECTVAFSLVDPGVCTPDCNISEAGLADIACNDNNTPANTADDFITFSLNPVGTSLAATYSVTGGGVDATATYGQKTNFETPVGTAGQGNIILTLIDADDSECTLQLTLEDPGVCTPDCNLTNTSIEDIACNDNGTPANTNDDYITFSLNPTGSGLGTQYTVTGPGIQETGSYGQKTNFRTPDGTAGNGNITLTVTDNTTNTCAIEVQLMDPGTCEPNCNLQDAGLLNIDCNDNNTPEDPNDDFITFSLNPTGVGLGMGYTLSGGGINTTATYGMASDFETPPGSAGKGNLMLTLTDNTNAACQVSVLVQDPGVCSFVCDIMDAGLANIICENNGTDIDITDDFLSFSLNPTGTSLQGMYTVSGRGINAQGTYGQASMFSLDPGSIGGYDIELTITDAQNNTCTTTQILNDPYFCDDFCDVSNVTYSQTISGIFNNECTACHGANNPQAGINLSTYDEVKKNLANPRLYGSIIHDDTYSPMPPGGILDACDIKKIKAWIDQGAPNN